MKLDQYLQIDSLMLEGTRPLASGIRLLKSAKERRKLSIQSMMKNEMEIHSEIEEAILEEFPSYAALIGKRVDIDFSKLSKHEREWLNSNDRKYAFTLNKLMFNDKDNIIEANVTFTYGNAHVPLDSISKYNETKTFFEWIKTLKQIKNN